MFLTFANIVAVAALGFLVWRRGRDRHSGRMRSARWLRVAGLIPLALLVALYLLFGLGEMASGDMSGSAHLLPAAVTALLAILAWMRPLEGGIALLGGATLFVIVLIAGALASGPRLVNELMSPALLITGVPQLVSGALFFIAGIMSRSLMAPGTGGASCQTGTPGSR